jgi:hypothetical protein
MKIPTEVDPNIFQVALESENNVPVNLLERDPANKWVSLFTVAANLIRSRVPENEEMSDEEKEELFKEFATPQRQVRVNETLLLGIWNIVWHDLRPTSPLPRKLQTDPPLLKLISDDIDTQVADLRERVAKLDATREKYRRAPPLSHSYPRISEIIFVATFSPTEKILPDWMDWINRAKVTPEMPLWVGTSHSSTLVKSLPDTEIAIPPADPKDTSPVKIRIFLGVPTFPSEISMTPSEALPGTWDVRWEESPIVSLTGNIDFHSRFAGDLATLLQKSLPGVLTEPTIESFRNTMYLSGPVSNPILGFQLDPIALTTVLCGYGSLATELELRETGNLAIRQPSLLLTYHPPFEESLVKIINEEKAGTVDFTLASEASSVELKIEVGAFFNHQQVLPESLRLVTVNLPNDVPIVRLEFRTRTKAFRDLWLWHILPILSEWFYQSTNITNFLQTWTAPAPTSRATSRASSFTPSSERNIGRLRAIAPDLFLASVYVKDCAGSAQPRLLQPHEIDQWEFPKRAIHFRNAEGKPTWYFGCPNPDTPYIGVKHNKRSNSDKYPVVPCCYPIPRDEPGGLLDKYLRNESLDTETVTTDRVASTQALLAPNTKGKLPPDLAALLSILSERIPDNSLPANLIRREGVVDSPASVVHAIARTMKMREYMNTPENLREEWVNSWRDIASKGPLDMVLGTASSKYGPSEKALREELADVTKYLDPTRWAPLLEWYFSCQLFLFDWQRDQTERFLPRQSLGGWVPRKNPIHPDNVLILVHRGGTINAARAYPRSEIISHPEFGVWGPLWTNLLSSFFDQANTQLEVLASDALYRKTNFTVDPRMVLASFNLLAQSLDADGNGIGVLFEHPRDPEEIWMMFPPFAALPLITEFPTPSKNWSKFRSLFPPPTSRTSHSLHWDLGTSVLVDERDQSPEELTLPPFEGLPREGSLELQTQLEILAKEERQSGLLLQMMIMLSILYTEKYDKDRGVIDETAWEEGLELFFNSYVVPDRNAPEITFHGMLRQIPFDEFDSLFQMWTERWSSIKEDGKIHLEPLLATKLKATMLRWINDRYGTVFTIPLALDRFYLRESDFDHVESRKFRVFFSIKSYERYIKSLDSSGGGISIKRMISISTGISGDLASPRPFIYTDGVDYYLIQPCIDGLFQHAINIALTWRERKVNLGFRAPPLPAGAPLPSTIVRKITETNQLSPLPPNGENSLQLLMDLPGHFSAILPL